MTCATSTVKFLAFLMNVLCCIAGAFMLSASAYSLVQFDASESIKIPCIMGVVLGGLLFATTIVGCCGAIRESPHTILVYAIFLLLLLLAQIAVIFALPIDFSKLAEETIQNAWNRQMSDDAMDNYQIRYECCGKNGPNDYIDSGLSIPTSCYLNRKTSIPNDLYTAGCVGKLTQAFANGSRIEIISDWTLVGVEGVTIIVACILGINFKNVERRRYY
ncbi:protein late bloomer [Bactrocera neohumeralis]|uniref:protein late bloomer n=1 Tax=Bactrocera tryoni TaxID=59916 RepID=UPI001A968821|nr:protein late bloomer [Bactrocera tryoni]XP_039955348.1 protein late bloomer [Bactrocera tryoni]XP_050326689.1 protein late bloomer [Bactrocera neohumeralis]XP_050326691.1 protein late bloomer [Bactrocera neohumeralis]